MAQQSGSRLILLFSILSLVVVAGAYLYLSKQYPALFRSDSQKPDSSPPVSELLPFDPEVANAPKATRSPYPLIPDMGTAGTYIVSSGQKTGPQINKVIIDPLDIKKGEPLVVQVILTSLREITALKGWLKTDSITQELIFKQVTREGITETWEGNLVLNASVDYTYIITFEATDGINSNTMPLGIRTP